MVQSSKDINNRKPNQYAALQPNAASSSVALDDLFIRPNLDDSSIDVSFTCPSNCRAVEYAVLAGNDVIAQGKSNPASTAVRFVENIPDCQPWSVESPFLYTLQLHLYGSDEVQQYRQTFGMTKIRVEDKVLYFNNTPLYIRGHIRGREAHDHPNFLNCSETEYYQKNIRMSKAFGFNFVRFHSQVPPETFLNAADRLGLLCQVEIRPYFGHYQKERKMTGFDGDQQLVAEDDWRKMILRLRNHPCVLVYCMGNEINQSGKSGRVKVISQLTKKLDDTRLFLDTSSRGEYDRDTVDIDVQHMSYYAPFGKHRDMFEDSGHLSLYGSIEDKPMVTADDDESPRALTRREITLSRPLLAHEIAHYNVLRDPYDLREKFTQYAAQEPWWVSELIKMIEAKGHESQYQNMLHASSHYYYIWLKQCMESVRKSSLLHGFHFLQLSDTDRYENANGLLDCFDDIKALPPEKVLPFNSPTVIIADLDGFVYSAGAKLTIPVHVSHFSPVDYNNGTFEWTLCRKPDEHVYLQGRLDKLDFAQYGNQRLCRIELQFPDLTTPQCLTLKCRLTDKDGKNDSANHWNLWVFPISTDPRRHVQAQVQTDTLRLYRRYPQLNHDNAKLMISERVTDAVFDHLQRGNDVLLLWRTQQNRDKKAPRETYYWPSTWDRFKGVIWDRGHNCGGILRDHPILTDFPHDGVLDWQLYSLVEDSEKICLDDFPVNVVPIIEGIDKAVRDRFDVGRFDLSEFQYDYTMRKFAYLFELRVGNGRLVVAAMNFLGLENDDPATCWMFDSIVHYMQSPRFSPIAQIPVNDLRDYLKTKGRSPRVKERMMTQYWQMDNAPLESKRYWKESEQWLREKDQ